jgi:ankyrin repeat protein
VKFIVLPLVLLWAAVAGSAGDGTTELHLAAHRDDVAAARALIERGASVDATNRYGVTPLSLACTNGSVAMVELLLAAGAGANRALPGGETPLMTAARTGNAAVLKRLLAAGAVVDAREQQRGQTALMWAAAEGHVAVVEALIAAGADFRARLDSGFTPLLLAAREGRIDVVVALKRAGADVNDAVPPMPAATAGSGWQVRRAPRPGTTALHLATVNGHFELAAKLVELGAHPNASAPGYTALHAVTWVRKPGGGDNDPAPIGSGKMSSSEFVRFLVARGADVNARMTKKIAVGLTGLNTLGATPFLLAARTADAELMQLLAELGADVSIPNADNANAVIVAAGLGTRSPGEDAGAEEEVVEALEVALQLGLDVNSVDNNGETAMHGAAYKNVPKAVELLASRGADIAVWNRKNRFGWTPLDIARGYRFGNFKPSPVTVAAIEKLMRAAGVTIPPAPPR